MGEVRNACQIVVGKPERKRQLSRLWRRYEYNIKMGLKEGGL
jgi:hypothetical protein